MKEIPTVTEIRDNILSDIKSKLYNERAGIPMLERTVWKILATAFAGVVSSAYQNARYVYLQIFTSTADLASLEKKGEEYGVFIKEGTKTKLEVQFTGESKSIVPKNTQIISGDSVYLTDETYVVGENGLVRGSITCVETGESSVKAEGTILTIMTVVSGVSEIATVLSVLKQGENRENTENYRSRIQTFERSRPQGGAIPDFINWALEVPGIVKAFISRPTSTPRLVSVYPLENITGEHRVPTQVKLKEVSEYLNDGARCPPCIVEVLPMTELTVDIEVSSIQPVSETLKVLIETAWKDYLLSRYPTQYVYEENVSNFIDNSGLIATALSIGASAVDLKITIEGGRSAPYPLKINEIAKIGAVVWKV